MCLVLMLFPEHTVMDMNWFDSGSEKKWGKKCLTNKVAYEGKKLIKCVVEANMITGFKWRLVRYIDGEKKLEGTHHQELPCVVHLASCSILMYLCIILHEFKLFSLSFYNVQQISIFFSPWLRIIWYTIILSMYSSVLFFQKNMFA